MDVLWLWLPLKSLCEDWACALEADAMEMGWDAVAMAAVGDGRRFI